MIPERFKEKMKDVLGEEYPEFINALEIHKERTDNSNFKNMKKLFLENILELKNIKSYSTLRF